MAFLTPGSGGDSIEDIARERVERRLERSQRRRDISRFVDPQENRLLRETWVLGSLLLVLIGIAADEIVIALVGAAIFVAGWLARLWGRLSLRGVLVSQELSHTHAFVGESLDYRVRVENRKLLPLPWLQVRIRVPPVLRPTNRALLLVEGDSDAYLDRRTSLRWFERVTWTYHIPLVARGFHEFGGVRLRSGDLFGFFTRQSDEPGALRLWVYPETVPLEELGIPLHRPYGERSGGQPLYEDPTRLRSLRDYRAGDSLKRVDWKATARHRRLRSRVYDPSANPEVVLALNVTTVPEPFQGFIAEIFEQAISVAATVATGYADARIPFGLIANCSFPGRDSTIRVPTGRSDRQLLTVLEALAMADSFTLVAMDRLLDEETRRFPTGSTVVLITSLWSPRMAAAVLRARQRGHRVAVVYLGIQDPRQIDPAVPLHDIRAALDGIEFTRVGGKSLKRADIDWQPDRPAPDTTASPPPTGEPEPAPAVAPTAPSPATAAARATASSAPAAAAAPAGGGRWARPTEPKSPEAEP